MNVIQYIGLGVHKKTVSYCVKTADGKIVEEGTLHAERAVLRHWAEGRKQAWHGAMEATLFGKSVEKAWTDGTFSGLYAIAPL